MKRTATLLIGTAALAVTATTNAQGYFPFGEIPGLDVKPTVQIDMNPAMMGFVTEAARQTDAEAAKALAGITNVRVYVYEGINDDLKDVLEFVDKTSASLERDGWHPAVRVNEDGEQVRVYMKMGAPGAAGSAASISGLTMMVTDSSGGDEAVFINIAGDIQAAQLGKIAAAIGMNGMFNMVPGITAPNAPSPAPTQ